MATTSETMWSQFWTFQRSSIFCKTSSVIEQLRDAPSGSFGQGCYGNTSAKRKGLTSLKLVGVDRSAVQYDLTALSEALEQNSSVRTVTICATFLQSLRHYYFAESEERQQRQELNRLFRAIGSLPKLSKVILQGNEDSESFPVECLAILLESNQDTIQTFSCQYVDMVASSQQDLDRLGAAIGNCRSLKDVFMLSLSVQFDRHRHVNYQQQQNQPSLDFIASNLGHCEQVQLGMRYREAALSPDALKTLLTSPTSGNLKKVSLRRRLPLQQRHLSSAFQSLTVCSPSFSTLKELHLDDIQFSSDGTDCHIPNIRVWEDMAKMLNFNTVLESLELGFAGGPPTPVSMDVPTTKKIIGALQHNTTLKRLLLRGLYSSQEDNINSCWLQLLEHDNVTLQELDISSSSKDRHSFQEIIEFYLSLNRQQVNLPDGSTCGLRALLRDNDTSIPQEFILPCLEAAMQVNELHEKLNDDALFFEDFGPDYNGFKCVDTGGICGLFYLLSQYPVIVNDLRERVEKYTRLQELETINNNRTSDRKSATIHGENKATTSRACSPLKGASPQLLLLDDDIVALW